MFLYFVILFSVIVYKLCCCRTMPLFLALDSTMVCCVGCTVFFYLIKLLLMNRVKLEYIYFCCCCYCCLQFLY